MRSQDSHFRCLMRSCRSTCINTERREFAMAWNDGPNVLSKWHQVGNLEVFLLLVIKLLSCIRSLPFFPAKNSQVYGGLQSVAYSFGAWIVRSQYHYIQGTTSTYDLVSTIKWINRYHIFIFYSNRKFPITEGHTVKLSKHDLESSEPRL